ncbi:lipase [Microbulbifer yueqingensis]|uniref:triacylglycerol lipase n=1 Tax=Microbulbifer yueqingensis TaxID=658219 RepID=A0A1G8UFN6_9GAMM|nr:RICIN domain-containing protein [Microbulbifer yueqingensis]SDJ51790.1 Triacylglycerol esterase/lipase EstA, alpha/beta hydrolase fold [Microbulbifer yueqingensis]
MMKRLTPVYLGVISLFVLQLPMAAHASNLPADRYTLKLAHSGKCVSVPGGSTSSNVQLEQASCAGSAVQDFDVSPAGDGFYKLVNVNSGKAMRVQGGSKSDGAAVVQYSWYDYGSQHFLPQKNGSGYILRNRNSGKCVELSGGSQGDGARLVQMQCTGSPEQTFAIDPAIDGERTLAPGRYSARAVHSGLCLDVPFSSTSNGKQLQQWSCNGTAAQQFDFVYAGAGRYEIINVNSGKCVDIYRGYTSNGTDVQQYSCNQGSNQRFLVEGTGDGEFLIKSALSGNKPIDVSGVSMDDGAGIHLWDEHGGDNQKWVLEPVVYEAAVLDGIYNIVATHSGKCLDVPGSSTSTGTQLQQYSCNGTSAQTFEVIHQADGYYKIQNTNSGLSLSVRDFANGDGVAIEQGEGYGSDNQLFRFVPYGSGYVIRPKSSYQCLDVNNSLFSSGYQDLEQYTCNYDDNQVFELQALSTPASYAAAQAANNETVVLLHGFAGWGRNEMFGFKYWGGGWKGKKDLQEYLKSQGHDTVTLAVGPLSSNWDRAVEAYYQLKGGCVNYGATHASTHGHAQYGRCFEALVPDWDASNKIHIIAHSQGGQTARVLLKLLRDGSPEENYEAGSVFEGGRNWVRSITTVSTPHNGTTLTEFFNPLDITEQLVTSIYRAAGLASGENVVYDLKLDQWALTRQAGESWNDYFRRVKDHRLWDESVDTSLYDLSAEGAPYIYGGSITYPDVYYFSYSNQSTFKGLFTNRHYPIASTFLPFMPQSLFMGQYKNSNLGVDASWFANDSVVNTTSMVAPTGAPTQDYGGFPIPGVWQHMGKKSGWDHVDVTGMFTLKDINPMYLNHVEILKSLN